MLFGIDRIWLTVISCQALVLMLKPDSLDKNIIVINCEIGTLFQISRICVYWTYNCFISMQLY
jgi:hypothetical protein